MKLSTILDVLNETRLFEMAYERKEAKKLTTDLSVQIVDHLIKLFVFNYPQGYNHWQSEINAAINKISDIKLKSSKRRLLATDSYQWLVYDSAPVYDGNFVIDRVKRWKRVDYKDMPMHDFDPEFVINKVLHILYQVCKDIERDQFYTITDYL